MKVCLYGGSLHIVEKSGVGQAIFHQKAMLESVGVQTSFDQTHAADVIHINTVFPDSFFKAILCRLQGKKIIYYGHSTMEDFKNSFKGSTALAPLFKRWIMLCYTRGDVIITPTTYSHKILKSYGIKKPIFALSNGIDTTHFQFDPDRRSRFRATYHIADKEKAVLSVGHFIARKGLSDFIEMARQNPTVRFFWFGHTNLKLVPEDIRTAIENAPDNLTFPGYVENDALRDAYCGCDAFLFMSHEETEGIVVLEALSCKIPVIVRDIPVYRDWLTNKVHVYKASDLPSFQTTLNGVLSGTYPDLRQAGRAVAESRNIAQMGTALLDIYKEMGVLSHHT